MGYARQHRKNNKKKYPKFEQGKQWANQASGAGFHEPNRHSKKDRKNNKKIDLDLEELEDMEGAGRADDSSIL